MKWYQLVFEETHQSFWDKFHKLYLTTSRENSWDGTNLLQLVTCINWRSLNSIGELSLLGKIAMWCGCKSLLLIQCSSEHTVDQIKETSTHNLSSRVLFFCVCVFPICENKQISKSTLDCYTFFKTSCAIYGLHLNLFKNFNCRL